MTDAELIETARASVAPKRLSDTVEVGGVGCALVTDQGNVFTGVCIDTASSLGLCAERNAIGTMITEGESRITTIVAVDWDGTILPPCGACREMMFQIHPENRHTRVLLPEGEVMPLSGLLPVYWKS